MGQSVSKAPSLAPQVAPPEGQSSVATDFGSNAEQCGGLDPTAEKQTKITALGITMTNILESLTNGLTDFVSTVGDADVPGLASLAGDIAEAMASAGLMELAGAAVGGALGGPAGAAIGEGLATCITSGASAVVDGVVGKVRSAAESNDPSAWLDAFAIAHRDALVTNGQLTALKLLSTADKMPGEDLCKMLTPLSALVPKASALQYRACVSAWASFAGSASAAAPGPDRQTENFAREWQLTLDIGLDGADPRKGPTIEGAAIPGFSPEVMTHTHMAGATLADIPLSLRIRGPGFEIVKQSGGEIVSVNGSKEGLELLRRLATVDDRSVAPALWSASEGALGDDQADLHIDNGAYILVYRHLLSRTFSSLGFAS